MPATDPPQRRTAAKITQPRLARPLIRQRLQAALDRLLDAHPMVWVAAPPGSGKTTLVSSYLENRRRPVLWYQVDERDEDLATWFHYLGAAAAQVADGGLRDLPRFRPELASAAPSFGHRFFERLFTALPEGSVLVFDNFQCVSENAALHPLMQVAVEELPADCRLMVVSRHLSPPAYRRLEANQQLATVDQEQLRFTDDEALALLGARGYDPGNLSRIRPWLSANRGWAAGLVLYSEWARFGHGALGAPECLGTEAVFDYFAAEIQASLKPEDARFLRRCALLPIVKPPRAAELGDYPAAEDLLGRLHRRNTFTTRFDGPNLAYEFHPLFREYLLKELQRSEDPQALAALQQRAAALLAEDGQSEAAVELLLQSGHWPAATALLRRAAAQLIADGRHRLLAGWMARIPSTRVEADPWLAYWRGASLLFDDPGASQQWMARAFEGFQSCGDITGLYSAWTGACRALRLARDDLRRLDPWIEALERLLDRHPDFPDQRLECQVLLTALGTIPWRSPAHPRLPRWSARALDLALGSGDCSLQQNAYAQVAFNALTHGSLQAANRHVAELRLLLAAPADDPLVHVVGHYVLGLHAYATGDAAEADAMMLRLVEETHELGLSAWDVILYVWHGFARLAQGDLEAAARVQALLRDHPAARGAYGAHQLRQLCTAAALEAGDDAAALEHALAGLEEARAAHSPFMEAWALLSLAVAKTLGGQPEAAAAVEEALAASRALGSDWLQAAGLTARALLAGGAGAGDGAAWSEAVAALETCRVVHMGSAPRLMREFAARVLEREPDSRLALTLLRHNGAAEGTVAPPHLEAWPWALKVFTLGPFRLVRHGQPVGFGRKPPRRPLQILQAVIAFGGREVPESRILDALWPDEDADAARNAFSTALNRLRKIIGHELIRLEGGRLSLDAGRCWVDAWAFEALLNGAGGEPPPTGPSALGRAIDCYQGLFLAGEDDAPWALALRERLQDRFGDALLRQAESQRQAGEKQAAAALLQRGLDLDPYREDLYQSLIRCQLALGRPEDARRTFEICRRRMALGRNRPPSAATEALLGDIGAGG